MATITINPINNNDILDTVQAAETLRYSGTEHGLDGAGLIFIYQIDYSDRTPWQGAQPTTAANGKWLTPETGVGYTSASADGVYTFTASSNGTSGSRALIQADHGHTPFEAVGLAFDGETQQLAGSPSPPTFVLVDQFITAEQTGINILHRDHFLTNNQANKLQSFFQRELQVLGGKALSSDLLSAKQIDRLTHLQADTADYVAKAPGLAGLQPDHTGWAMPAVPSS